MSDVGQRERRVQDRVVELSADDLGYEYIGNLRAAADNSNVIEPRLVDWLERQGHEQGLITRALHELDRMRVISSGQSLYDANRDVYSLLRYGFKGQVGTGEQAQQLNYIDWDNPENNDFAVAEEVTVAGNHTKRPDVVLYVNGIALAVLELKRSTVSVGEGIRQMLDNQKPGFIPPFFSTVQLVMAGNDTEGLRYSVIETPQKYWLEWKEDSDRNSPLDADLEHLCRKERLLELVHDFVVFDAGTKKIARHNQYFGVKAAQQRVRDREGGIIWHTQGSGKSLTMVWLAKWIREHQQDARVLIVTDREELDDQIEKVFHGVDEDIYRTTSGADLIEQLREGADWLLCTLVHKFGAGIGDEDDYLQALKAELAKGFKPRGNLFVFVDECHRTQSGKLHKAMRELLPDAMFIGFTGTPLLKADKARSIEVFGSYIHTYKFDEAVRDGVVLDLRYEARDIDQRLTSPEKVDQWFDSKTQGLSDLARVDLKRRWGTLQKVLTAKSRLEKIVSDIMLDMATRDRLMSGRGNALLVCSSIYEACKFYEAFSRTELKGKCAIVTSYRPTADTIKGEETGEGETEALEKYEAYRKMVADYFDLDDEEEAVSRVDEFEDEVKKKFVEQPGQMKLLIVVDKLLTGFDAPPATYLYIDKTMHDHGLFQAICRVNRLDGEDKEYGCIIDYQDLFKSLEDAVHDYTSGAFEDYDNDDVAGLLENRIDKARERLEETREQVKALCEPVGKNPATKHYVHYFCTDTPDDEEQLKDNEPKRLKLYKMVAAFVRAYADLANEMADAGYSEHETEAIIKDVRHFENVRKEVKLASGDYVDLKQYEPAMRHLLDSYIEADESEVVSDFDEKGLVQLIVERGPEAIDALPKGLRDDEETVAETIVNNVRRVIIDERAVNPKYYEKMSELLNEIIKERRRRALDYKEYLERLTKLAKDVQQPGGDSYPSHINSSARRALYDNLDGDDELAVAVDDAVRRVKRHGWRGDHMKEREVWIEIDKTIASEEHDSYEIFELVKAQDEY